MPQPNAEPRTSCVPVSTQKWLPTRAHAMRIALSYGVVGALWILLSGWLLHHLVPDPTAAAWLETIKGWFFIAATTLLLGLVLDRYFAILRQSVTRAHEGETRLHLLGDNLPDSYVYQYTYGDDDTPRFTYISAGVERVHGLRVDDILRDAQCLHSQIDVSQRAHLFAAERESARTLADFSMELLIHRSDGATRYLELRSRPRRNQAGHVEWDGFIADVTKLRQAEADARAGEERMSLFIQNAPVALAMFDRNMCYLAVSPRWKTDFHLGDRDLVGKCHYEIFPEIPESLRAIHRRCMQGEVVRGAEDRFDRADGTVQWLRWEVHPWRTLGHTIGGIIISSEDVTERKQAEKERLMLATAMEQAAEAICITDPSAQILYVNPAFERTTGYTRNEAVGQTPRILKSGKQDAAFYQELWSVLGSGEVWRGHFINKRKDGSLFEEDAAISPVRDQSGTITNYVAIKLDVTHEVALRDELRQIQKLEAIGQLAGGVAHDFNNILAVILMQTDQAMEEELSSTMQGCMTDIKIAAERAAALTRQLLLFSRRQVMQPRIVDLNEAVTNLAKMLRRILGEQIQLRLDLHAKPLWVSADAGMLDQVIMNLSVNARDAMPQGGRLTVATGETPRNEHSVHPLPPSAPNGYVWLSVADDGCGIPPDVLPHIFEPFFTTKEAGRGTGLGLATVFGIVKQHNGWVDVHSEPGQGTTFQILLPASEAGGIDTERVKAKVTPPGGSETILLVEDDLNVARAVRHILRRYGYGVLEATDGRQALAIAQQLETELQLLLTDMVLPGGMDGHAIAARLRTTLPNLKVVYMSGYSPELAGRPLQLGRGEGFIQKPFEAETVLATIRRCLDG